MINSDIEIIDPDLLAEMSTISTREQMSARLNHTPGKSVLNRYVIDPWALQLNGSREVDDGPLLRNRTKSLQGGLTYDLRIQGQHTFAGLPGLGRLPVVKSFSLVPRKVSFGATFQSSEQAQVTIAETGLETVRPIERRQAGKLTGSIDYMPMPLVDLSFSANSDRDLLRRQIAAGVNIGRENGRTYDLRMTLAVPKNAAIPAGAVFAPARLAVKGLNKLNPSLTYSGGFGVVHDPAQRQPGDPEDIRSISNSANWDLRLTVPVGDAFKALFPEQHVTGARREQMLAEQRRLEDRNGRQGGGGDSGGGFPGGAPGGGFPGSGPGGGGTQPGNTGQDAGTSPGGGEDGKDGGNVSTEPPGGEEGKDGGNVSTEPPGGPADELLTPEERQRREEDRLLQAAEDRLEQERAEGREPAAPAPGAATGGGGFGLRSLFEPVVSVLRSTSPLKITHTSRTQSSYVRLLDKASFWYQAGFTSDIDSDESRYASSNLDEQQSLSLSTTTKATKQISVDLKYSSTDGRREQLNSESRTRREDWPDVQFSLSGMERWRFLGGRGSEGEGWLRSSSITVGYKRSLAVSGYTATVFNPTTTTTIQPRWTFTFPSGLSATLNANLKVDDVKSNGVLTTTSQSRYGVTVRHQFAAQRFLAKLGLYKPGASQNISMDVDLAYQTNRTERDSPGQAEVAPTGDKRLTLDPRFTYQISRNLSGALRLKYARSRNIATDQTSTTLGLGVEATFVF